MGDLVPKGEAVVEDTFSIAGRGLVIKLRNGWTGRFTVGDIFQRGNLRSRVTAVEFLDDVSAKKSWIGIIIEDQNLGSEIKVGDTIEVFGGTATGSM